MTFRKSVKSIGLRLRYTVRIPLSPYNTELLILSVVPFFSAKSRLPGILIFSVILPYMTIFHHM